MPQTQKLELDSLTIEEMQNLHQVVHQLILACALLPDAQLKILIKCKLLNSYINFHDFQELLNNAAYEIEHSFRLRMRLQ
jgi:hypothetical protein